MAVSEKLPRPLARADHCYHGAVPTYEASRPHMATQATQAGARGLLWVGQRRGRRANGEALRAGLADGRWQMKRRCSLASYVPAPQAMRVKLCSACQPKRSARLGNELCEEHTAGA